jgi:hypothetical protein
MPLARGPAPAAQSGRVLRARGHGLANQRPLPHVLRLSERAVRRRSTLSARCQELLRIVNAPPAWLKVNEVGHHLWPAYDGL